MYRYERNIFEVNRSNNKFYDLLYINSVCMGW